MKIYKKWKSISIVAILTSLILLIFSSNSSYSQKPIPYKFFHDFLPTKNIDSLEKALKLVKKDPFEYSYALIKLESSRSEYNDDHGKSFNKLDSLYKITKAPIIKAMVEYYKGRLMINGQPEKAFKYFIEANEYFEKNKDTTGMLFCFNKFLIANINLFRAVKVDEAYGKKYYDKIMELGEKSTRSIDKIIMVRTKVNYNNTFYNKLTLQEELEIINQLRPIVFENSDFQFFKPIFYKMYANAYFKGKQYELAHKNMLLFFNEMGKRNSVDVTDSYFSLGCSLFQIKEYEIAEKFFLKAIYLYDKNKVIYPDLKINIYENLIDTQLKLKKFNIAWKSRDIKDSLILKEQNIIKLKLSEEIQTKYDVIKKNHENENLIKKIKAKDGENMRFAIIMVILSILIILFLSYFQSVTARELKRAMINIKELQKSREKFFTIIAHDLRNPLNGFMDLAKSINFLMKGNRLKEIENLSSQIDSSSLNLSLLLNNLLNWSLGQQGQLKINSEILVLKNLINEIVPAYNHLSISKEIMILVFCSDNYKIKTDKNLLGLIVRNLIDNAIRNASYSSIINVDVIENYYSINIRISNCYDNENSEKLEMIKKLFNDRNPWEPYQNSLGLGLIFVQHAVLQLKTKMTVSWENNKITFELVLPKIANKTRFKEEIKGNFMPEKKVKAFLF